MPTTVGSIAAGVTKASGTNASCVGTAKPPAMSNSTCVATTNASVAHAIATHDAPLMSPVAASTTATTANTPPTTSCSTRASRVGETARAHAELVDDALLFGEVRIECHPHEWCRHPGLGSLRRSRRIIDAPRGVGRRCNNCAERNPARGVEGLRRDMNRLIKGAVVVATALACTASPALADDDYTTDAVTPSWTAASAESCADPDTAPLLSSFDDDDLYAPAPGGDFDGGAGGWQLENGAFVDGGASGGLNVLGMSTECAQPPRRRIGRQPDVLRRRALPALPLLLCPGVARGGRRRPGRGGLPRPRQGQRAQGEGRQGQARPRLGAERQDQVEPHARAQAAAAGGCSRSDSASRTTSRARACASTTSSSTRRLASRRRTGRRGRRRGRTAPAWSSCA